MSTRAATPEHSQSLPASTSPSPAETCRLPLWGACPLPSLVCTCWPMWQGTLPPRPVTSSVLASPQLPGAPEGNHVLCTHRTRAGAWGLLAEGGRKGEKKEGKEGEEVGDPMQKSQTPHLISSSGPAGDSRNWMQKEGRPDPEANPQIQNSPESSKDREGPLQVSNPGNKLHSLPPSLLSFSLSFSHKEVIWVFN